MYTYGYNIYVLIIRWICQPVGIWPTHNFRVLYICVGLSPRLPLPPCSI